MVLIYHKQTEKLKVASFILRLFLFVYVSFVNEDVNFYLFTSVLLTNLFVSVVFVNKTLFFLFAYEALVNEYLCFHLFL